jgi:hypothetical protein
MTERFKGSLPGIWLLVSSFCLLLPVFLPSSAFSANPASNVIGTATATMFMLSFPTSLFGLPLLAFTDYALGLDPNSLQGMYLNLLMLFVLGLVQWFWIVPRAWQKKAGVQTLGLQAAEETRRLTTLPFTILDRRERTPVERVISDDEEQ